MEDQPHTPRSRSSDTGPKVADSPVLAPFGVPVSECRILDLSVSEWQEHAVARCVQMGLISDGLSLQRDPQLVFSAGFLDAFLRRSGNALRTRAVVVRGPLHRAFGGNSLGELPPSTGDRLIYGLEWHADQAQIASQADIPAHALGSEAPRDIVISMAGTVRTRPQPGRMDAPLLIPVEPDFIWRIGHWCDLLVANLLMLPVAIAEIPEQGSRASATDIHPTAIVERCQLGARVRVGPFALLRDAIIADGVTVGEYASIGNSYVGPETTVQSYAQVLESVIGSGSVISFRTSVRGSVIMDETTSSAPVVARSVIGRRVFLSRGLDISASNLNGDNVCVWRRGERVDTGISLLGCAVGDDAKVGGLHLPAGYEVPAGCIVAPRGLARLPAETERGVPLIEHNGRLRKLQLS